MKLSLEWLGQYVDIPKMSSKDIALELTMKTAEVEEVIVLKRSVNGIIVGEITEIEPLDTGKSDKTNELCDGKSGITLTENRLRCAECRNRYEVGICTSGNNDCRWKHYQRTKSVRLSEPGHSLQSDGTWMGRIPCGHYVISRYYGCRKPRFPSLCLRKTILSISTTRALRTGRIYGDITVLPVSLPQFSETN